MKKTLIILVVLILVGAYSKAAFHHVEKSDRPIMKEIKRCDAQVKELECQLECVTGGSCKYHTGGFCGNPVELLTQTCIDMTTSGMSFCTEEQ